MTENTTLRIVDRPCQEEGCERSASWPTQPGVLAAFCEKHTVRFFEKPAWLRRGIDPVGEGATMQRGADLTGYLRYAA